MTDSQWFRVIGLGVWTIVVLLAIPHASVIWHAYFCLNCRRRRAAKAAAIAELHKAGGRPVAYVKDVERPWAAGVCAGHGCMNEAEPGEPLCLRCSRRDTGPVIMAGDGGDRDRDEKKVP